MEVSIHIMTHTSKTASYISTTAALRYYLIKVCWLALILYKSQNIMQALFGICVWIILLKKDLKVRWNSHQIRQNWLAGCPPGVPGCPPSLPPSTVNRCNNYYQEYACIHTHNTSAQPLLYIFFCCYKALHLSQSGTCKVIQTTSGLPII